MLGSAKTNLPLLTLTSWVKGTSPFVDLSSSSSPFQHSTLPSLRTALIQTTPREVLFLLDSLLWWGDWQRYAACLEISLFSRYFSSHWNSSSAVSASLAGLGSHWAWRLQTWLLWRHVSDPLTCNRENFRWRIQKYYYNRNRNTMLSTSCHIRQTQVLYYIILQ